MKDVFFKVLLLLIMVTMVGGGIAFLVTEYAGVRKDLTDIRSEVETLPYH